MAFSSTRSEIVDDLDYQNAPESVDSEVLESWVAAYRAGDDTVKDKLIRAHLRVVKTTADVFATRNHKYHLRVDLVQEAFMIMLSLINSAKTELEDNKITAYIVAGVRYRLRDFVEKNRNVYMPGRTFRDKRAKGQEVKGLSFSHQHSEFIFKLMSIEDSVVANFSPIAPPDDVSPEFAEAMDRAIVTDEERKVVDLRIAGSSYRDCEVQLGLKRDKINRIIKRIHRRFNSYYA